MCLPTGRAGAAIFDSHTWQSTPESGAMRRKGRKAHVAVDMLDHLVTRLSAPANAQDRAQVGELAQAIQEVTGSSVEVAFIDQGNTGDAPVQAA